MKHFFSKLVRHKVRFAVSVIVVLGVVYAAYAAFGGKGTVAPQYITAQAARGTLVVTVSGSGQVSASNQVNVEPRVSGTIVEIPAKNNEHVIAGDLLLRLDPTNDERAARNAQSSLDNANLELQTLIQPPSTSSVLQAQGAAVQAEQALANGQNNLATDYTNAFTEISNTYIDIPAVMTGLNNVLNNTVINKTQSDAYAYADMISSYTSSAYQYRDSAMSSYNTALASYNQSLIDYKTASVYSSTSTVEALLNETYDMLKAISAANSNTKNLLDLVGTTMQQYNIKPPSQLAIDENNLQSYIGTTNTHLANILEKKNGLQTDKNAIAGATISVAQTAAALAQLQSGPTDLQIQAQKLAVTQAQNALSDAEQNLAYDSIRAPFSGIITNINVRPSQPVSPSTILGVLVSDSQLAQGTLNEVDVVNVKVGQKANISFDALPNLSLTGTVSQVDTIGTVSQGVVSYNVQVALDVPNDQVRPGMSDTISIITNAKQNVLMIPNSAIKTAQGAATVQKLGADGKPVTVQVVTGISNDTMTEIISGLNEGDAVVTQTITKTAAPAQSSGFRIPGLGGGGAGGGGALRAIGR